MSGKANSDPHADVLVAVDDLFFFAKIEAVAKTAGTKLLRASEPCQLAHENVRMAARVFLRWRHDKCPWMVTSVRIPGPQDHSDVESGVVTGMGCPEQTGAVNLVPATRKVVDLPPLQGPKRKPAGSSLPLQMLPSGLTL